MKTREKKASFPYPITVITKPVARFLFSFPKHKKYLSCLTCIKNKLKHAFIIEVDTVSKSHSTKVLSCALDNKSMKMGGKNSNNFFVLWQQH